MSWWIRVPGEDAIPANSCKVAWVEDHNNREPTVEEVEDAFTGRNDSLDDVLEKLTGALSRINVLLKDLKAKFTQPQQGGHR